MNERIVITVNGQQAEVLPGASVAAAVMPITNGLRHSGTGAPRAALCGMGVCFECRLTVDGVSHMRSCQVPCRPGMRIDTAEPSVPGGQVKCAHRIESFDVLVIGAGPAGMAAACCAAEAGKRVGIVDENLTPGGQIWRHDPAKAPALQPASWLNRLDTLPVTMLAGTQIFGSPAPRTVLAKSARETLTLRADSIILACGARERFLPFPGWTLPGVFGAGGLQALVKAGYPIAGRKVVVVGSGPLLLAVAAYLRGRGAEVRLIAEQTPRGKLWRFGASLLLRQPGKIAEALGLGWRLRGTPYRAGCWPTRAEGDAKLAAVTLTDGNKSWTEPCDALACGFGLVPNLELPMLLGCAIDRGFVRVDDHQQTSIPGIFAIGELTGIGGLDKALIEGQIAGWSAAHQPDRASRQHRARGKAHRFVELLDDTFALRDELRQSADECTIVCRCEDVTLGQLEKHANRRDAKLQTRCGMGPCQGRICGPALQFLFGWDGDSVRPPILPTELANLAITENS